MIAATILLSAITTAPAPASSADDIRVIVAEALRDADSRSSLLLSGNNAGHDGKYFIASDDGDFRLNITGQVQFRYLASFRDDQGGTDDLVTGFQTRRTKVVFDGHLFDESLRFKVTNSFSRSTGADGLSDAFVAKDLADGVTLLIGQAKLPFSREYFDSSKRLLAVERSLVSDVFDLGRSQGVQLAFEDDAVRGWLMFSDGANSNNIDFGADPTDWAITARGEWLPYGSFKTFRSQAGARDAESSLRIGGAVHAEERDSSPGDNGGQTWLWTIDAAAAGPGWSAFASYIWRENDQPAGGSFTDSGATAQLGVWATDDVLPFVRWELLIPDSDRAGDSTTNVLTAGANWYLHGDALKLTVDGVWLVDDAGSNDLIGNITGAGILAPGPGDDEFVLRVQLQMLF